MDVEIGSIHMPIFLTLFLAFALSAQGAQENAPMHWSGDKTIWDRNGNRVELIGHAAVHQPDESITADYITFDKETRTLDARGNCIYVATDVVIYSDEMHFNLDSRTGTILGGRVAGEHFSLTGERINKLGPGRFQTHRGDYSTCWDCPQSWTFQGGDVDMEFESYAYMSNVSVRVKDIPIFWMPYMIVPLKTKRQTGFLLPKIRLAGAGVRVTQPFFWAINRSTDMLFGLGYWGGFGPRFEWEGRYKLGDRSEGKSDLFYVKDPAFEQFIHTKNLNEGKTIRETPHRWAISLEQKQELPFKIDEKFKFAEVSDNFYPRRIGDVQGSEDAAIRSSLSLSRATEDISAFVEAQRYRNLINPNPMEFDAKTVQAFPTAVLTTNDRFLFNTPVAAGVTVGMTNFTRTGGDFDRDAFNPVIDPVGPDLGKDPIRRATRVMVTPSLYTTLRPWDAFSIVPSFEDRLFFYSFHNAVPNLSRSYLLFRTDFTAQLERIYETSDLDIPKIKHLVRPFLTFNLIPYIQEPSIPHPLLDQMNYAKDNGFSGYQFDSYDIVPIDSSRNYNEYFTPIGKSLSYGFTTQLIRRRGSIKSGNADYQKIVELRAGQTVNFREFRLSPEDRQPFSPFIVGLRLSFDKWNGSADYTYFPYGKVSDIDSRSAITLGFSYVLNRGMKYQILEYDRSLDLRYTLRMTDSKTNSISAGLRYSLSDYILPRIAISYNLIRDSLLTVNSDGTQQNRILGVDGQLRFQGPSRCWKFELNYTLKPCDKVRPDDSGLCGGVDFNLTLNLVGSGFGGITEVTSQVVQ